MGEFGYNVGRFSGCLKEIEMNTLNIQSLVNAIVRLNEGWAHYLQDISDTQIRDGLIQRFKFTYEISHKILKRFLENTSADPNQFDMMSFQDLIRTANERHLLFGNWADWKQYRDMRIQNNQIDSDESMDFVIENMGKFIQEMDYLSCKLERNFNF